jgi:EAL domain-containing protein (putative c-di-GMP-specific phosphodiesterase class I)
VRAASISAGRRRRAGRARAARVALDTGAGFGSFHRSPQFAYLKIDGAFIRGIAGSAATGAGLIARRARSMGARTIAEYAGR